MPSRIVSLIVLVLAIESNVVIAESPFDQLKADVTKSLRNAFPEASLTSDTKSGRNEQRFAYKMRSFTTYTLDKAGNWQGEQKTSAPDRGGFAVQFYVQDGPWMGQLAVPCIGTEDHYMFKNTYAIMDTATRKSHIWAFIMTPRIDESVETRDELIRIFERFAKSN